MSDQSKQLPLPPWIRVRLPQNPTVDHLRTRLRELGLHTVCESAFCPNIGRCWASGRATILILGNMADGWDESNLFHNEATYDDWQLEVGSKNKETLDKLNRVINFVNTSSDEDFKRKFNQYLDLSSSLNYYILLELFSSNDNVGKNLLMITYDGKVWYPTLYDLDETFGVKYNGKELFDYNMDITQERNKLFQRLRENFSNEIADRYFELREDIITKENLIKQVNKFYNKIPMQSFAKDRKKWNNLPGYDISQIYEYINERIPILDNIMKDLYTVKPNCQINFNYYCKLFSNVKKK